MTDKIIDILYKRLAGGTLSPGESQFLERWIEENPDKRQAFVDSFEDTAGIADLYRARKRVDSYRPLREMNQRLGLVKRHRSFGWKTWSAAAAVAVVVALGIGYMLKSPAITSIPEVASASRSILCIEEIAPGASQAVVTLPDGDTLHLNGSSEINLRNVAPASRGLDDLKIEVPRGGEFVVVLEDSTRVWLNSESKLIYPSRFSSESRIVSLEGEAYFKVSKEQHRPFYVETAGQRVKVYGTEFNIRSYEEDAAVYTTLSEGKVSLSRIDGAGGEIFLSPGKQAVFDKSSMEAKVRTVDIETVTGWRHGRFVFEEQTLLQIMRDLGRWYDFDFEFDDPEIAETVFMGSIPRYSNFKTAIAILEKSGNLSFEVKNNILRISRKS